MNYAVSAAIFSLILASGFPVAAFAAANTVCCFQEPAGNSNSGQEQEKDLQREQDDKKHPLMKKTPEGFVLQKLGGIGGRMFKPNDWVYKSGISGKTIVFKIYEPMKDGQKGFDNGLTINLVLNAEKATKMKPSAYAQTYLKKIRAGGKNPVDLKKETYGTDWVRDGIIITANKNQTGQPKDYRIVYEAHADDKHGFLVIVIFGSIEDRFDDYYPIYKTMTSEFVLVDSKALNRARNAKPKPGKKKGDKKPKPKPEKVG